MKKKYLGYLGHKSGANEGIGISKFAWIGNANCPRRREQRP